MRFGPLVIPLLALLAPATTAAQSPAAKPARGGWTYAVAARPANVKGVLVLLPGSGANFDDFAVPKARYLPAAGTLAARGIATVLVAPAPDVIFGDAAHLDRLEDTLTEVIGGLTSQPVPIAIGGLSRGGTDALLLAERCASAACRMPYAVRAVFTVDAPLDYGRLLEVARREQREKPPLTNLEEARLIEASLLRLAGADAGPTSPRLLEASPLTANAPDGGRARALAHVAVRAYTEPDVQWWLTERNVDYYGMNALDAASLVRHLRLLGNADAALVTTTGRGVRPDGRRHPHSWSIVDEADLACWVQARLAR